MSPLENSYKAFLQKINLERLRIATLLVIVLVPASILMLDYIIYPEYVKTFLPLRLACTILSIIILVISYTKIGAVYATALGIFEMSNVAIMIAIMIQYLGYETPYYAGLNLIILGIGVVFPWGVRETLLTCGLVYSCYLVPSLLLSEITNLRIFANNNIFLLQTVIIAVTASYFSSALRRREFEGRYQLEKTGEDLKASKQELAESYEKLQEYDRAKSRFFANISHELRTPTTFILGPVQMLIHHELGLLLPDQEKYIRVIHRNATRLLNIINRLLDLVKSEAKSIELVFQRNNFVKFADDIVQAVLPAAEKKSLTLSFSVEGTIPEFFFDSDKMEEVLFNLLSNSLKFTPSGGITVSCSEQSDSVLVKVTDTGIGIPAEAIPKIFDRFYQVDNELSRVGMGTGIGLALVKDWVELHGGKIWVESEVQKGSTFLFTIPIQTNVEKLSLRKDGEEKRGDERRRMMDLLLESVETPQERPLREKEGFEKILVVDDTPDMLTFISDQLKSDYDCLLAKNGAEGIHRARAENPDLIISDVMMPVKDGYQLCRELKSDPQTASIPIILLTAKGSLSDKIEGLEEGADDYLTKPFNKEELKARVHSLINLRKLQKEVLLKNKQLEKGTQQLEEALEKIKRKEQDLVQAEKMSSLGLLTAGVAHEINNPISFSKISLSLVKRYFDKMEEKKEEITEPQEILDLKKTARLSLDIIQTGLDRTAAIVRNLHSFVRKDELFTEFDIHAGLDATLTLLNYQFLRKIEVHRDYYTVEDSGKITSIPGIAGQLNQAFMNILLNAVQAIETKGEIFIKTIPLEESVQISIRDTGCGISESDLPRVFEPFFTTKEVGQGTGLGMAITYKIIVETHRGKIDIKSRLGEGTDVLITLPKVQ